MVTPSLTWAGELMGNAAQADITQPAARILRGRIKVFCNPYLRSVLREIGCNGQNRGGRGSLFEQRRDQAEYILGDHLIAAGSGVGLVALHHAGGAVDVIEQKGQKGDVVFLREDGVGLVELADVVGAVVGREGDAGESDFDAGLLEG